MTDEAAKLLRELHTSGQTGLAILIVILVVLVLAGAWMFFLQRRFIALTVDTHKIIDSKIKAADALREESRKSQEYSSSDIVSRINSLGSINDELRKEIERLSAQQKSLADSQSAFRQSVKDSIAIGLQDIKERMSSVTVNEILTQIPTAFKDDLQVTVVEATRQVVAEATKLLQRAPSELIDLDGLTRELEKRLHYLLREMLPPWLDPRDWREREYYEKYDKHLDELARRMAYHLTRHRQAPNPSLQPTAVGGG